MNPSDNVEHDLALDLPIALAAAEIRKTWDAATEEKRRVVKLLPVEVEDVRVEDAVL